MHSLDKHRNTIEIQTVDISPKYFPSSLFLYIGFELVFFILTPDHTEEIVLGTHEIFMVTNDTKQP